VTTVATEAAADETKRIQVSRFAWGLGAIVLAGFVLRVVFVVVARGNDFALRGDDFYYHWQANAIADGHWFVEPLVWRALGRFDPTAGRPPLYSLYLAGWSWVGLGTVVWHRLASCVLGAATVALVGLTGRRIAGPRAGLLAGAAAAVYANLWLNDAMLISESMYQLTIAGTLLAAYSLWQRPRPLNAVWLGLALGCAALTRPEGVLISVFLVIPFVVRRDLPGKQRLRVAATTAVVAGVLVAPWLVRNLVTFERPVLMSSGAGSVGLVANCDTTYSGQLLGYWDPRCLIDAHPPRTALQKRLRRETQGVPGYVYLFADPRQDESERDAEWRSEASTYVQDHLDRAPIVALARVGRIWGVFRPFQGIKLDAFFERRGVWPSRLGLASYYALMILSGVGLVAMRRRKVTIAPVLAVVATVTITTALAIGITRYRAAMDVALVIMGGVGADAALDWFSDRRARLRPDAPAIE
jgi:hypothetical protein